MLFLFLPIVNWFVGRHYAGEVAKFTEGKYSKAFLM